MLIGWGIGEKLKLSKALANLSLEVLQVMVQTFYMVCRTKPVAFSPHHPSSSVYLTWLVCISSAAARWISKPVFRRMLRFFGDYSQVINNNNDKKHSGMLFFGHPSYNFRMRAQLLMIQGCSVLEKCNPGKIWSQNGGIEALERFLN